MYKYPEIRGKALTDEEEKAIFESIKECFNSFSKLKNNTNKPVVSTEERNAQYVKSFNVLCKALKNNDVDIKHEDAEFMSNFGNISIHGELISIDSDLFMESVMYADNFEVYPQNGGTQLNMGFYKIDKEVSKCF